MSYHYTKEEMKPILNRISRAIGHLEYVKRMIEDEKDCTEVLIQLSAVRSAINNTGLELLKEYMDKSMEEAIASGDEEAIENLKKAIVQYCK